MSCFNNVCAIGHTCCIKFHQSAKNNLQDQVCSVLTALVSNWCTADLCRWHEIFLFLTFITHLISEHLKYFFASYWIRKRNISKEDSVWTTPHWYFLKMFWKCMFMLALAKVLHSDGTIACAQCILVPNFYTNCMQTYTYTSIEMRFGSTLDL